MAKRSNQVKNISYSEDWKRPYSYNDIFSRNRGALSESEQEILSSSTVAIAGVGGIGGLLAERLIRIGIGRIKFTDPGKFEPSNLNRQFGSSTIVLDKDKTEVVYQQLKDINPYAKILYDTKGINTQEDADRLAADADLVIDEMDAGLFKQSIRLQRAARRNGNYYFFTAALGFGALLAIFEPAGFTLEEYNGLPCDADLNKVKQPVVSLEKIVPIIPSYVTPDLYPMLKEVVTGRRPVPSVSIGVGMASILSANEAVNILLKKREIPVAPKYTYIDLMDRKFTVGSIT